MGLLDFTRRVGHGIVNGLDSAAYNSLGGGLLGDALGQQGYPMDENPRRMAQAQSGGLLGGVVGDGATPENRMLQTGQDAVTGRPSILQGNVDPAAQSAPAQAPPQQWQPSPQQRHQLRGQFLTALSAGLRTGDYQGAQQGYQQNALAQIHAGQQQHMANQRQQMLAQFQQDAGAARTPAERQAVAGKWVGVFPKEVQDWGASTKAFEPPPDDTVGQAQPGIDPATGKPGMFLHTKSGKVNLAPGMLPPQTPLAASGNRIYDPASGMTDSYTVMVDGKPANVRQNLRTGEYTGADGKPIDINAHQVTPYEKPAKDPNFNPQRAFMVQAGGDPDDQSTWTPQVLSKFHQLTKPAPGASITNNYGPAPDGSANPTIGAMARYEIPVPTPRSSSPAAMAEYTRLIAAIRKENPHYDATTYPAAQKTINDFATGKEATSVNAINTAAGHVGVLAQAAKALDSGDITVLNRIANAYGTATGSDKLSVYKTIVNRLAPEITRAYVGAGGGEGDRASAASDFDPSLGTKRILANLGVTSTLFNSKINALGHQFEKNAPGRKFEGYITPEAQGVFDALRNPQQQVGGQSNPRSSYLAGHIYGGKTFLGGDPNNANSWR